MALRIGLKPALPLIPLLPGLSLVGVLVVLLRDGHGGGLSLLQRFVAGAVQPCIDPIVLGSLLNGLQITLVIAVMSWGISSVLGVGLGLLSSSTFWEILADVRWPALILRRWLAPLRAVHELIWGLLLLQVFGLNGWVAICAIAIPYTVLMARVIADQVDCHVSPAIPVLKGAGATPWAVMLTGLVPPLAEPISDHIGHRLDCALRSALILGVFGLGGLGTDLSLSLRSLQFQELWSGLWLLAIAMVVLDRLLRTLRNCSRMLILLVAMGSPWVALGWGTQLDLQLTWPVAEWSMVMGNLIDGSQGFNAALEISWPGVIGATVWITLIAGCVATGLPPLLLLAWPCQAQAWFGQHQQQQCGERCRDKSQRPPHHSLQTQAGLAGPNQQQQWWKAGGNTTGDQGDPHRGTNYPGPRDLQGSIESLGSVDEVAHNHRPLSHWPGQLQIQLCSPAEGDPGAGHGHGKNQHA